MQSADSTLAGDNVEADLFPQDVRDARRERNRTAILETARDLFLKHGYERTTLRVIAKVAGVSASTVVKYFGDKKYLLAELFDTDHRVIHELAVRELSPDKSFLDQSIDGFRPIYRYYSRSPEYARAVLATSAFPNDHDVDQAIIRKAYERTFWRIRRTIEIARDRGEIRTDEDDDAIVRVVLQLFTSECRAWLGGRVVDVEEGLAALRRSLAVVFHGLKGDRSAAGG